MAKHSRRTNKTGRSLASSRYVALHHWLMRTEAWRNLDCMARAAYVELSSRYGGPGSNNGRIPYSLREMAQALNCSKATAMRALERLQDHGFVVRTKKGAFRAMLRVATEWRLTEFADDMTGEMATKDFARWATQNKTPFRKRTHAGAEMKPAGFRDETADPIGAPVRFQDATGKRDSWFHQRDASSLPGGRGEEADEEPHAA